MPKINPLTLSDSDFANLSSADELAEAPAKTPEELAADQAEADRIAAEAAAGEEAEAGNEDPGTEVELTDEQKAAKEAEDAAALAAEAGGKKELTDEEKAAAISAGLDPTKKVDPLVDPKAKPEPGAKKEDPAKAAGVLPGSEGEAKVINYEEAFKEIMKPFKANGKMISLKTPQEAIQLMQMGANYTRKLQELQPSKKLLMMLENNGLLDEGKLSFLIDLEKKNPEAIKKLVKDSGINPMEIDVEAETTYQAGNHQVTDTEALFRTVLEDVRSQPKGQESLIRFNTEWDQASKEVLWKTPQLMNVMHQQIELGVYDLIEAEVARRRVLGQIPVNTPFLDSYKMVGDEMVAEGAFDKATQPAVKAPVATTVAAPKKVVANGAKASAASPTRSTPRAAGKTVNPLAMSDDDFLKQMQDRL